MIGLLIIKNNNDIINNMNANGEKMILDKKLYDNYVKILENELVPALGCTEPIAIAYAAAKAREVLGEFPDHVEMRCSGNIIKNVKGVTVPNSDGQRGIDVAAILGIVGGDASRELEVLESVKQEDIEKTRELAAAGYCTCTLQEDVANLYIVAKVCKGSHYAEVTIINRHTYITRIVKDDVVLFEAAVSEESSNYVDKSLLNVKDILEFANTVNIDDVREVLKRQIEMNSAIADEGLMHPYGAQIGRTLLQVYGDDVKIRAKARAAAGSDARMGGCSMPVVINSGSGNQGMTVSLPVIEFAKSLFCTEEQLYRALVVSNLVAIHQKKYIGSLSAYCGATSAATGAACGVAYMMLKQKGEQDRIYQILCDTITNSIETLGGMVCDGAKASCAAKIGLAVENALMALELSLEGNVFQPGEGMTMENPEDTIAAVGRMGRVGMKSTDVEILNIMLGN